MSIPPLGTICSLSLRSSRTTDFSGVAGLYPLRDFGRSAAVEVASGPAGTDAAATFAVVSSWPLRANCTILQSRTRGRKHRPRCVLQEGGIRGQSRAEGQQREAKAQGREAQRGGEPDGFVRAAQGQRWQQGKEGLERFPLDRHRRTRSTPLPLGERKIRSRRYQHAGTATELHLHSSGRPVGEAHFRSSTSGARGSQKFDNVEFRRRLASGVVYPHS